MNKELVVNHLVSNGYTLEQAKDFWRDMPPQQEVQTTLKEWSR